MRYVLDGDGQRVGEVHEREPEWDDAQRMIMLAYTQHVAQTCSECGHSLVESTDPDNEDRYRVPLPSRCHSCTALEVAFKKYETAQHPRALHFDVELLGGA